MEPKKLARTLLLAVLVLSVGALAFKRLAGPGTPEVADTDTAPAVAVVVETTSTVPEELAVADPPAVNDQAPATDTADTAPPAATRAVAAADPAPAAKVVYFHGNFRCNTCNSIEAQAGRTVQTVFAADVAAGRLDWSTCNIDKAGNEHFEKDFQLTSASLVLTDGRGAQGRWKVLDKTWELVGDSLAFSEYVTAETRAFLAAGR